MLKLLVAARDQALAALNCELFRPGLVLCDGVAHSGAVVDECGNCGGAWCEPSDDTEFRIALGGDTQLGRFIDQFVSSSTPHVCARLR